MSLWARLMLTWACSDHVMPARNGTASVCSRQVRNTRNIWRNAYTCVPTWDILLIVGICDRNVSKQLLHESVYIKTIICGIHWNTGSHKYLLGKWQRNVSHLNKCFSISLAFTDIPIPSTTTEIGDAITTIFTDELPDPPDEGSTTEHPNSKSQSRSRLSQFCLSSFAYSMTIQSFGS